MVIECVLGCSFQVSTYCVVNANMQKMNTVDICDHTLCICSSVRFIFCGELITVRIAISRDVLVKFLRVILLEICRTQ